MRPSPNLLVRPPAAVPQASPAIPRPDLVRRTAAPDGFEAKSVPQTQLGPLPAPLPSTPIETLYTDPFHQDTLGDRFVELVDGAKTSVDGSFYEILDDRIVGSFVRAAQRGVQVHLVTDDNYFKVSDTQASLDRNVSVLSQVYDFLKQVKAVKTTKPDWQTTAQNLLDQLPQLEQTVSTSGMPDSLKPDLVPVRSYLAALAKGDATGAAGLKQGMFDVNSAVSSRLGGEKVRQQFRPAYDQLLNAGVQIKDDESSKLTHDKYMVLDDSTTFVGSYNLQGLKSDGGAHEGMYCTADNAMVLHSADLSKSFLSDFHQMFDEGKFHDHKDPIDAPTVRVGGVKVTPFFAPRDPVEANITADLGTLLNKMRDANAAGRPLSPPPTIRLAGFAMSYSGTEALVDMLCLLKKEGADVQVMADALSAGTASSSVKALRAAGVQVNVTNSEVMMHDKFISVQAGRTNFVYTGSANFTHDAWFDNDEAVLKVESLAETRAYNAMFESLRDDVNSGAIVRPVPGPEAPNAPWTKIDPRKIKTIEDAEKYATLRWGL
jgi:phosphatidylserine/phosphatidylglycerophosphate/cardiolipin synthase-like enzyme